MQPIGNITRLRFNWISTRGDDPPLYVNLFNHKRHFTFLQLQTGIDCGHIERLSEHFCGPVDLVETYALP